MTKRDLLNDACAHLEDVGVPNARRNAEWMLCDALSCSVLELYIEDTADVGNGQRDRYDRMVACRAAREPLQYITGTTEFMSLPFVVGPGVFIPRPDTEILVEIVERYLRTVPIYERVLLADLCCGAGVIGVSLAAALGNAEVVAVDVSAEATALTRRNAALNQTANRVDVVTEDAVAFCENAPRRFQAVACNPPYIETSLIRSLPPEVRDHEPVAALDGGLDGLDFYRTATRAVSDALVAGGMVAFEIGDAQAEDVGGFLRAAGFRDVCVAKDMAGRDRVVHGIKQAVENG